MKTGEFRDCPLMKQYEQPEGKCRIEQQEDAMIVAEVSLSQIHRYIARLAATSASCAGYILMYSLSASTSPSLSFPATIPNSTRPAKAACPVWPAPTMSRLLLSSAPTTKTAAAAPGASVPTTRVPLSRPVMAETAVWLRPLPLRLPLRPPPPRSRLRLRVA